MLLGLPLDLERDGAALLRLAMPQVWKESLPLLAPAPTLGGEDSEEGDGSEDGDGSEGGQDDIQASTLSIALLLQD